MRYTDVYLWENRVGRLAWDSEKQYSSFVLDSSFLQTQLEFSPILIPLKGIDASQIYSYSENRDSKCFVGLPSFIADSLPDKYGKEIIRCYYETKGLIGADITPLHQLSYIGKRGMGAFEFVPAMESEDYTERIELDVLAALANDVLLERVSFKEKLLQKDKSILDILKIGTSAGGAKPKAIIAYNEATGEVRSGQVKAPEGFDYYLIKFSGSNKNLYTGGGLDDVNEQLSAQIGPIEYAYYLMAKDAGINMSYCKLLEENGVSHFMTKRFDRTASGDKIHMQTMAGIANLDRDYPQTYEMLFVIANYLKLPYESHKEIFRRMVFNVLSRNHDDHTKNHSFLINKTGKWSLAPAYDLCYSYDPTGQFTKHHQMYLNGKNDEFTYKDLEVVARKNNIVEYKEIIQQVENSVSKWEQFAEEAGVLPDVKLFINKNLLRIQN